METPKEYHYVYYSYEEWGRGYFGSRTCKCLPEDDVKYFGSYIDKTFKPTQKIIIKSDYLTRKEALIDEIKLQQYYKVVENPYFANQAYQTTERFHYRMPRKKAIRNGRKSGIFQRDNKLGIHRMTREEKSAAGKKGFITNKNNKTGLFSLTKKTND